MILRITQTLVLVALLVWASPIRAAEDLSLYLRNLIDENRPVEAALWIERLGLETHPDFVRYHVANLPSRPFPAVNDRTGGVALSPNFDRMKALLIHPESYNNAQQRAFLATQHPTIRALAALALSAPSEDFWIEWLRAYPSLDWDTGFTRPQSEALLAYAIDAIAHHLLNPRLRSENSSTLRLIFLRLRGQLHPKPDRRVYLAADFSDLLALDVPTSSIPRSLLSRAPEALIRALATERLVRLSFINSAHLDELLEQVNASDSIRAVIENGIERRLLRDDLSLSLDSKEWPKFLVRYLNLIPTDSDLPPVWRTFIQAGLQLPSWTEGLREALEMPETLERTGIFGSLFRRSVPTAPWGRARYHLSRIVDLLQREPLPGPSAPNSEALQVAQSLCSLQFSQR